MSSLLPSLVSAAVLLLSTAALAFDECSTAPPFSLDFNFGPFSLSSFGGTDGVGDPIRSCTGEPGHSNLWGVLSPTTDGFFRISGTGHLTVYSGTCGALTEIACSIADGSDSVLLLGGQTYYIEVSGPPDTISFLTSFCGDGNVAYQACDDGNLVDTDGCTNACTVNVCGDGTLYTGVEECEDGNLDDTDACTATCTVAECGDGSLHAGFEECDDGNLIDGDGCESDCTAAAFCGNGAVEPGEECDDANASNTDACVNGCQDAACGDGFVRAGVELCDDGNLIDGDGCESTCVTPSNDQCALATTLTTPAFGNENLTGATTAVGDPIRSCTGQQGPHNRWYTVMPTTSGLLNVNSFVQMSVYTGTCGALVEAACQAGPGLLSVPVTAGTTYFIEFAGPEGFGFPFVVGLCGDGAHDPFEDCDDGNGIDTDACSNTCHAPACGDGSVQDGEQCDDGNLTNGDGCENDCFETATCGDGVMAGHETCDDGNTIDDDGCDGDCRLPCPDDLCKCLGAAQAFALVGGKLNIANDKISGGGGPTEFIPTEIDGSVCGLAATFAAKPEGETEVTGDVVLTALAGTAGNFKSYKLAGVLQPGTFVGGDLATGGGIVKGPLAVEVGGAVDVTGMHPLVAACTQAKLDVATASATLAALAPTQTIPTLELDAGAEQTITVGAGRQVVSIPSLKLKGDSGDQPAATLTFQMQANTEVLIVNVAKLYLGRGAEILFEDADGGASAVVNVVPDGKASLKADAAIDAPLLAGTAKFSLDGAFLGGLYGTNAMKMKGAGLYPTLECE